MMGQLVDEGGDGNENAVMNTTTAVATDSSSSDHASKMAFICYNIAGALLCVAAVAVISGLFLGYLTLDVMDLEILQRASHDADERRYAGRLIPIVQQRHRVLVSLLLLNALAYETLPLFLDQLIPSWVTVLLSTTAVLLFGEIIPSAIFTGPNQLYFGYQMVPLMECCLWILSPLTRPLVWVLDTLVHGHIDATAPPEEEYNRGELTALIRIQHERSFPKLIQNATTVVGTANFARQYLWFGNKKATATKVAAEYGGIRGGRMSSTTIMSSAHRHHPHSQNSNTTNVIGDLPHPSYYRAQAKKMAPFWVEYDSSKDPNVLHADWRSLKKELIAAVAERERERELSISKRDHYYTGSTSAASAYEVPATEDDEDFVATASEQLSPPIHPTEVNVVEGALQMQTRVAMDVYTPLHKVYSIPEDLILNKSNIAVIYREGYARIPVYRRNVEDPQDVSALIGFLKTRQLMMIDWDDARTVSTLPLQTPPCVGPKTNLVQALQLLRLGSILAFVCARPDLATAAMQNDRPLPVEAGFMGILTLEDIMESILQDRIYDDVDVRDRERAVATLNRWAATKLQALARKLTAQNAKRRLSASRGGGLGGGGSSVGGGGSVSGSVGDRMTPSPVPPRSISMTINTARTTTSSDLDHDIDNNHDLNTPNSSSSTPLASLFHRSEQNETTADIDAADCLTPLIVPMYTSSATSTSTSYQSIHLLPTATATANQATFHRVRSSTERRQSSSQNSTSQVGSELC